MKQASDKRGRRALFAGVFVALLSQGAGADLVGHMQTRAAVAGKSDEALVQANPILERFGIVSIRRRSTRSSLGCARRCRSRPVCAPSRKPLPRQTRRTPSSLRRIRISPSSTVNPPRRRSTFCASSGRRPRTRSARCRRWLGPGCAGSVNRSKARVEGRRHRESDAPRIIVPGAGVRKRRGKRHRCQRPHRDGGPESSHGGLGRVPHFVQW